MTRDPRFDTYIDSRADFAQPILAWLRERVHAACPDVVETIKWSHLFFDYKGKPLAGMAAFKAHATFGFWDRKALATGQEGEAMGQYGRITAISDLPLAEELEAQVKAATARIDAGASTARPKRAPRPEAEVPPELIEALAADDSAAAAFNAFSSSCRREYCEWIAEAKRPETKAKRVAEAVGWMREGKRRNWKYEGC